MYYVCINIILAEIVVDRCHNNVITMMVMDKQASQGGSEIIEVRAFVLNSFGLIFLRHQANCHQFCIAAL